MGDPVSIGLLALTGAGTGIGLYGAKRQKDKMSDEKRRQNRALDEAETTRRNREQMNLQQQSVSAARAAQKRRQLAAGGLSQTIKTSPLGLPGGGQAYGKQTLIGGGQ